MEVKEYTVIVEILNIEGKQIVTGSIVGIKGTVVQCNSIPEVFTALGVHLRILDIIKNKK